MRSEYTKAGKNLTRLRGKKPITKWWTDKTLSEDVLAAHKGNFGWVLGEQDLVIDVDTRGFEGDVNSFDALEKDLEVVFNKTVKTPGGFHCYVVLPEGVVSSNLHGGLSKYPGIDFLGKGRQCVIEGSVVEDKAYTWHEENFFGTFDQPPAPTALIELLSRDKPVEGREDEDDPFAGLVSTDYGSWDDDKVKALLATLDPSMGNNEWVKVGMALHNYHPTGGFPLWEEWSKGGDNYLKGECFKRWKSFNSSGGVTMGTLVFMANEARKIEQDGDTSGVESEEDMDWDNWKYVRSHNMYADIEHLKLHNKTSFDLVNTVLMPLNKRGSRTLASTTATTKGLIESIDGIGYLPMYGKGVHDIEGDKILNTFNHDKVPKPDKKMTPEGVEAMEVIASHFELLCGDAVNAEILTTWIACQVQNQGELIRWAPLIQGVQGCGKSFIGRLIRVLIGDENVGTVSPTQVSSTFNGFATDVSVNILEEISIKGHNRYDAINALKPLITEDIIQINEKGINAYKARNTTNYILFTNDKSAIPIDDTERRYWVIFAPFRDIEELESKVGMGEDDYFERLWGAISYSNRGQLRKAFEDYTVANEFKSMSRAPMTDSMRSMVATEESAIDGLDEVRELIETGGRYYCKEVVCSADIFSELPLIKNWQRNNILTKLGYEQMPKPMRVDKNSKTRRVWTKGALTNEEVREIIKRQGGIVDKRDPFKTPGGV